MKESNEYQKFMLKVLLILIGFWNFPSFGCGGKLTGTVVVNNYCFGEIRTSGCVKCFKRVPSFCDNIVIIIIPSIFKESFQVVKNSLNMSSLF